MTVRDSGRARLPPSRMSPSSRLNLGARCARPQPPTAVRCTHVAPRLRLAAVPPGAGNAQRRRVGQTAREDSAYERTTMSRVFVVLGITLSLTGVVVSRAAAEERAAVKVRFEKSRLDSTFRSEGGAAGDFNHDGHLDIAVGSVFYAAPEWKMHLIADKAGEYDPLSYSNTFCNF